MLFQYLSQRILPGLIQNQESNLKRMYRPLELKFSENGLKVVKNSFLIEDDVNIEQFDQRKEYDLKGKNISFIEDNNQDNPLIRTLKDEKLLFTRRLNIQPQQGNQVNVEREHYHLGLLNSLLYNSNEKYQKQWNEENNFHPNLDFENKIKIMICVTVHSEKLQELEKSMNGITQSLDSFLEQGFLPHQIGVTVIFDGIANVCNQNNGTCSSYHSNIITYFQIKMDKKYGVRKQKTLAYQYNQYVIQQKRCNDYKPENISYFRAHRNKLLKKYQHHRQELLTTMKNLNRNAVWNEADEYIEQNIINAMMEQHKRAKIYLANRKNTAWVYQDRYVHSSGGSMPIFHVFKFTNGSKLSSHMWFFEGFCKELNPDYCVLMDVGADPAKDAIFKLIMAMEADKKVGGVCGTMRIENEKKDKVIDVELDPISDFLINEIYQVQKCQSCEYDIAHFLDKQAESALDFIHVLPGAFSAYRYKAFFKKYNDHIEQREEYYRVDDNAEQKDNSIMKFYLRSVLDQNYEHQTIQEANMFLAEDRVLCQKLFCQGYYLRYIPDSIVYVDACETLKELLLQRRRWINGSWYALNYVAENYGKDLNDSGHSTCDKLMFMFSITQGRIQQLMIYLMESFQIVWSYMILCAIVKTGDEGLDNFIISTIIAFYIFLIFTIIYLAINLANKRKKETDYYFRKFIQISSVMGFISIATVAYTINLLINEIILNSGFTDLIDKSLVPKNYYFILLVLSIAMRVIPVLSSIILSPQNIFNVITTILPYFYYQPTYAHLFVIYSFCRIDDFSWGKKGLTAGSNSITSDKAYQKYLFLLKWILINTIITAVVLILINAFLLPQGIILMMLVIFTILMILKGFMAFYSSLRYQLSIKKKIARHIQNGIQNGNLQENKEKAKNFSAALENFFKP